MVIVTRVNTPRGSALTTLFHWRGFLAERKLSTARQHAIKRAWLGTGYIDMKGVLVHRLDCQDKAIVTTAFD